MDIHWSNTTDYSKINKPKMIESPSFYYTPEFKGYKQDYVFTTREKGTGYYKDKDEYIFKGYYKYKDV